MSGTFGVVTPIFAATRGNEYLEESEQEQTQGWQDLMVRRVHSVISILDPVSDKTRICLCPAQSAAQKSEGMDDAPSG